MYCCRELKVLYTTIVLILEVELLGGAMETKRSSILVAQNADDLKSLELCTTRNQQRLGSVFGHRRRTSTTTTSTQSTVTVASEETTEAYRTTELYSETPYPKLPKALRLSTELDYEDVNLENILEERLVRRHIHQETAEHLEESSLATTMSRTKKMYRDSTGANVNKISAKGRGGIFLTENCTTVIAQIGTTAILHCEVSDITENTVTWIRKKDYSLLSVGLVTYSADSRFFSAHGRHVKVSSDFCDLTPAGMQTM
ncbi:putative limbic system-associated membrane protein [Operophtera brumata]|uniref:Putative limbic system-associated membrane protein n=1 Tax=Operophtera brumata TaxID=104452 RepID=A0A0L7LK67_OPEBR|nr:putative limbic system-associated membrane protein [Operophtera brumata]